jgi:hypothetical protein
VDALPIDLDEAVSSPIATYCLLAKQFFQYPLLRLIRNAIGRKLPRLSPMLFEVRNSKESIEERFELVLEHHTKVPATLHQHEQVRQGNKCCQGPQNVIGEAIKPGRDCV